MKKRIILFSMVLALMAVMALPMAASAASGTTTITGDVEATITLVPPNAISFDTFTIGDNLGSSTISGSVTANTSWTMTVSDTKTNTKGYMTLGGSDASGIDQLGSSLKVCTEVGGSYGDIASYQTALRTSLGYNTAAFNIPLFVLQTVAASDHVGSYSITLTYVVTPS